MMYPYAQFGSRLMCGKFDFTTKWYRYADYSNISLTQQIPHHGVTFIPFCAASMAGFSVLKLRNWSCHCTTKFLRKYN
eukprot:6346368-Amphidinium_carterae.1